MDYGQSDSSGTDDDLPPPHMNRMPRGGSRVAVNGRSSVGTLLYGRPPTDMEYQIHWMEKEAYSAVLRAFIAQSDVFSWDKEGLISELRKELRVSDMEHRELLGKVNADDLLRRIREWRQGSSSQHTFTANTVCAPVSTLSPTVSASRKKQKTVHVMSSQPPPIMPPAVHAAPSALASSASARRVSVGVRGKKSQVMSLRDIQWDHGPPVALGQRAAGKGLKKSGGCGGLVLSTTKGRGLLKGQPTKGYASSHGIGKKGPDSIEILATDKLIKEVERVCGVDHPNPNDVEKAKVALREHEQSLIEAIARLDDASDEEDGRIPHSSHIHSNRERAWRNRQVNGNQNCGDDVDDTADGGRCEGLDREPMIGEGGTAYDDQQDDDNGDADG